MHFTLLVTCCYQQTDKLTNIPADGPKGQHCQVEAKIILIFVCRICDSKRQCGGWSDNKGKLSQAGVGA